MSATGSRIEAKVEAGADGRLRILAPDIGWWTGMPRSGAVLGNGADVGRLRQLHRVRRVVLPPTAAGRVIDAPEGQRRVAVEYGQRLFELEEAALGSGATPPASGSPGSSSSDELLVAPTDGVFYRSPSPDAPPFVEPGARVQRGQPVGLIEVMKTFNQITFDGPGLPEEAEVVELLATDGGEVAAGDPLLRFSRPKT